MPTRIDMGTDVAMVGLWDPAHEVMDPQKVPYEDILAFLQSEAQAGRLFYINTGGDGSYPTDVYVDEQPDAELLGAYALRGRAFLIESKSGRLIAGGLEDFASSRPQITSDKDAFAVEPGRYALCFYELDQEKVLEQIKSHFVAGDLEYYESRHVGCMTGCLLFVAALVLMMLSWVLAGMLPWLWMVAVGCLVLWAVNIIVRQRRLAADEKYHDIARRIEAFYARFSSLIFVLERVSPTDDIQGGWYDLV